MNTKNNKRRRKSIDGIKAAFFELLGKKELQRIKVSEICELASINRSTFYANYLDVYDLAEKICGELESEVNPIFELDADLTKCDEEFLELFRHIKDHRELYQLYFKLGYETRRLKFSNLRDFMGCIEENLIDYHIEFFRNGFNAIVKLWIENDCGESPERMRDILLCEYRGRFSDIIDCAENSSK